MINVIRNVRDIDAAQKNSLENLLGVRLHDDQQIEISILGGSASGVPEAPSDHGGVLPEWCNVYHGLTAAEIEELETAIVRTSGSRCLD